MFPRPFARRTRPARTVARLHVEQLEARETPTVNVLPITAQQMASDRSFFLPLTVTNTPTGTETVTVDTHNSAVVATVLTGTTIRIDVNDGATVHGSITVQLFDKVAPNAVQRVLDLISSGFYTNKQFFRVDDLGAGAETNIIVQGGGLNNTDNSTLPNLEEEFDPDYTFASNGLLALAKTAIPDTSNSQIFFTDLDRPLSDRIEELNYRYTIFGIITAGFDVYTAIKNAPRTGTQPNAPIVITGVSVVNASPNRVIQFVPGPGGFTGTTSVTITATDGDNTPTNTTFNLTGLADPNPNSQPFLNPVPDTLTAVAGQPTTLTLSSIDREADPVTYVVRNYNPGQNDDFSTLPANLSVSIDQASGKVTLTPAAGFTGTLQFRVGVRQSNMADTPGNYAGQVVTMTVNAPTSPPTPATFTVVGSDPGGEARVTVTNADGSPRFSVLVFETGFTGGVRVARGDVNGDGKEDIVAVPGLGGAPVFKVLDSDTGEVTFTRLVFEDTFRGGLFVAVSDTRGLGYAQVLVSAGETGGPRVTLYDVRQDVVLTNFFASDSTTRGGTTVDLAALTATGSPMIITAAGPGSGPLVSVFDPTTGQQVGSFFAGDQADRDGIRARAADTIDSSTNTRHILVAPFHTTGTTDEKDYDPGQYIPLIGGNTP